MITFSASVQPLIDLLRVISEAEQPWSLVTAFAIAAVVLVAMSRQKKQSLKMGCRDWPQLNSSPNLVMPNHYRISVNERIPQSHPH